MTYKQMLVDLITSQYESLTDILSDFPSEDATEKVVEGLEECISLDINIDSTDPDATADVTAKFDDRSRNSVVRDLDAQISSSRSKVQVFQSEAVRSLFQAMYEDIERAQKPTWSWENEDEDTTMWGAEEWLESFKSVDAAQEFWGKMLLAFSPTHPYISSCFDNNMLVARYPIIKALKSHPYSKAWEWVSPILDKLKTDPTCNYQKTLDYEFRDIWAECAARYARTGDLAYKNKCEQLEQHGFTPAPHYIDLTGMFVLDETQIVNALNRLMEISGMHNAITSPSDAPEKVHGFKYLGSLGAVSSATIVATLRSTSTPAMVSVFSKFVLEQQIGATSSLQRGRKM